MSDLISRQVAIEALSTPHGILYPIRTIESLPSAQPEHRDNATAHKVVSGCERDGETCWFECDNCGLAVDIGDVFCKHCGARFVP